MKCSVVRAEQSWYGLNSGWEFLPLRFCSGTFPRQRLGILCYGKGNELYRSCETKVSRPLSLRYEVLFRVTFILCKGRRRVGSLVDLGGTVEGLRDAGANIFGAD